MLSVYDAHRVGLRLSPEPYLCHSREQTKYNPLIKTYRIWPDLEPLDLQPTGCILVDSVQPNHKNPRRCLYIVNDPHKAADVASLVNKTSMEGIYYGTLTLGRFAEDPSECPTFVNESDDHMRYWKDKRDPESFNVWIQALREYASFASTREEPRLLIWDNY